MLTLPGYRVISDFYGSATSLIYRGYREADSLPVILKLLRSSYPTPEELARYRQEYEIISGLELEGVVKAYEILPYQNTLVMVLEDFGGESLRHWMTQRSFSLEEVLRLGIQITQAIGQLHQQHIIHRDINPANLVWNPRTHQLKLIDFGLATRINRRNPTVSLRGRLEGTLAYLSPEQTGRMNRSIDYRTDFYSLGITLYELLTHHLPYSAQDALELIHCHLARSPIPLSEHNSTVPDAVAAIVLKLLSKMAEDRYQSWQGIEHDLKRCLQQLQETGCLVPFSLAQEDKSDRFQIPQKLYGREAELQLLLEVFERVAGSVEEGTQPEGTPGSSELMLIAGYSGSGKTSLVQELYKPITQRRGYFIAGKFAQYQRDTPYQAFIKAFSALIAQLLTESEAQLNQWREELLSVLRPNTQVLIEVLPDLELIVGSQPPVAALPAIESRNRFNQVFQTFIQVFAQPHHPLVIFLDDLQWADGASLQLMQTCMTIEQGSLLLIGAYRENEVGATHPLHYALEEIQKLGIGLHTISLSPLQRHHIQHLLVDTLKCSIDEVASLADLLLAKTDGNPFFMNEFLKTLYVEGLLTFHHVQNQWHWSIDQIQQRNITDNVVELLANKIRRFHPHTQLALQRAACIGNRFSLQPLTTALSVHSDDGEFSSQARIGALREAVSEGVLVPLSDLYDPLEIDGGFSDDRLRMEYQFAHDRLQQAAYSLLSETERQIIHLHLGRALLKQTEGRDRDLSIFEIVYHLNDSQSLLQTTSELMELAQLNLLASRRARATAAFQSALRYWQIALTCLPENRWEEPFYELTASLYLEGLELEYLNGNFEQAETLAGVALTHIVQPEQQIKIYRSLIRKYTLEAQYDRAIEAGKKALQILGMDLPSTDLETAFAAEVDQIETLLAGREIGALLEEPDMVSLKHLMITNLLVDLIPTAYIAHQTLFAVVVARVVHLSLQYGHSPDCSHGYSAYGVLMASLQQKYGLAYEFGKLALGLCERFNNLTLKCRDSMAVGGYLACWVKPLSESISILNQGYVAGLESGEIQFAGYILFHKITILFCSELEVSNLLTEITNALQFTRKTKNQFATDGLLAFQLAASNLLGQTTHALSFDQSGLTEAEYLSNCQNHGSTHGICSFQLAKMALLYWYGEFDAAIALSRATQPLLPAILGEVFVANHAFYHGLILAALYSQVSDREQAVYLEEIRAIQQEIHLLANQCPQTFSHRFLLISAEIARITGQVLEAMDGYDRAIAIARKNQLMGTEALANELAGKFYLSQNREKIAGTYFLDAYYGYSRWGAISKAQHLKKQYPQFLRAIPPEKLVSQPLSSSFITTEGIYLESLDLATVTKVSQVLSGELNLQKLLTQLMTIVLEYAGAQTGCLLLERNGPLQVVAIGTVNGTQVDVEVKMHPTTAREEVHSIPLPIIQWVARKQETVVFEDAAQEPIFATDPYFQSHQPKSILCTPIRGHGKLIGALYLENNSVSNAFTADRATVLQILTSQAAIALENAQLYEALAQDSQTLETKNRQLEQEVSDRRRAEERLKLSLAEREILLKEIHHRVKNNLQIVSGLLQLQAQSTTDPATINILRESQHRVESMSLIHKKLYFSAELGHVDLADYIPSLASSLLMSYQIVPNVVELDIQIDSIILNIDQAIPCGLIINELVSNALKYAFPDGHSGTIHIGLHSLSDRQVELIIQDTGVGLPETVSWDYTQSLGLSLVKDLVLEQLEGTLTINREGGTTFQIRFPQMLPNPD